MAIQMRRGPYSSFNAANMVSGEFAFITAGDPNTDTGKAIYACFETGTAVRFGTYAEVIAYIQAQGYATGTQIAAWKDEVVAAVAEDAETASQAAETATTAAESVSSSVAQIAQNTSDIAAIQPMITGAQGTEIAANTNLNSITTYGRYYSPNSTRTGTLTNKPSGLSVGFTMDVDRAASQIRQTIYGGRAAGPDMWVRNGTASAWSAWYKVTMASS